MLIKRNGGENVFGHDVHGIFTSVNTPEAFEHLKTVLRKAYPQLATLNADVPKTWVAQAARKLNIPYDVMIEELESQMLRSYLINKRFKELSAYLADPNVSLTAKEKYSFGLRARFMARIIKLAVWALVKSAMLTVLSVVPLALILSPVLFLLQFNYVFVLLLGGGLFPYSFWKVYQEKNDAKLSEEIYNILSGGGRHA